MPEKRELLISKGWIQAILIVGLCGFLLLGILVYRTYTDEPPIPSKVSWLERPNSRLPVCRLRCACKQEKRID